MDRGGREDGTDPSDAPDGPNRLGGRNGGVAPGEADPEARSGLLQTISVDDADPPQIVETAGQIGVYLGLAAVAFAVVGVGASSLGIQPAGTVAMAASLALVSAAMVLGMAFQAYVSVLAG